MSSIRGDLAVRVIVVAVLSIALLSSCSRDGAEHFKTGAALTPSGEILAGTVGPQASYIKVGTTYGFAFPLMTNTTSHPVKLLGAELENVPENVSVQKYGVLSEEDTSGYMLSSIIKNGGPDDYTKYPDHSRDASLAPHALSPYYPVVYLVPTGKVSHRATGCRVNYQIGDKKYEQVFTCSFSLTGN